MNQNLVFGGACTYLVYTGYRWMLGVEGQSEVIQCAFPIFDMVTY